MRAQQTVEHLTIKIQLFELINRNVDWNLHMRFSFMKKIEIEILLIHF